jgi:hypothetical protein
LKAIAYKPGWYSSDTTEVDFYVSKYRPDSLIHLLPPDNTYKDEKRKTLIDGVKGDRNLGSGKWVGFRNNRMEALMIFNQPSTVSAVSVSSLVDIGGYLMPPLSLELWGGDDSAHLKLLGRIIPAQPSKMEAYHLKLFDFTFKGVTVRYLKLIANPVTKLPHWHPGKGEKGWFFVDEVIVN